MISRDNSIVLNNIKALLCIGVVIIHNKIRPELWTEICNGGDF